MMPHTSPTRDEFYRDKQVVREEWFVHDGDLVSWARLRVFSDGMADVWDHGELWGFVNEACARVCVREGHYVHRSRVEVADEREFFDALKQAGQDERSSFSWGGDWSTGLTEPGSVADPAGYMLSPDGRSPDPADQ